MSSASEETAVDCHTAEDCLHALRVHLAAMQNVEDDLAEAYDVHAAMTLAQLMELQGPLHRFNALADRMVAIVDYLAHTMPHLPPAAFTGTTFSFSCHYFDCPRFES
jgi:hypothetical protein